MCFTMKIFRIELMPVVKITHFIVCMLAAREIRIICLLLEIFINHLFLFFNLSIPKYYGQMVF